MAGARIQVNHVHGDTFQVTVTDGSGRSTHTVTVDPDYLQELTGGAATADEIVRRSFEFLLAREPKESILGSFTLSVIRRYFPEYEAEMGRFARGG